VHWRTLGLCGAGGIHEKGFLDGSALKSNANDTFMKSERDATRVMDAVGLVKVVRQDQELDERIHADDNEYWPLPLL
jgi:hypothetical protein